MVNTLVILPVRDAVITRPILVHEPLESFRSGEKLDGRIDILKRLFRHQFHRQSLWFILDIPMVISGIPKRDIDQPNKVW